MSWIGPAPHSPQVIASLAEDQRIILRARPGLITMWRYLPPSASVGEAFQVTSTTCGTGPLGKIFCSCSRRRRWCFATRDHLRAALGSNRSRTHIEQLRSEGGHRCLAEVLAVWAYHVRPACRRRDM